QKDAATEIETDSAEVLKNGEELLLPVDSVVPHEEKNAREGSCAAGTAGRGPNKDSTDECD
ncbi:unnamed protein product, partial [Amoebophrya sp. A120]